MMNSAFALEQARQVLLRPEVTAAADDAGKIRALYRALLQRAPDATEEKLAAEFLAAPHVAPVIETAATPATPAAAAAAKAKKKNSQRAPAAVAARPQAPLTAWEELAQVLLLSNEVAFVD
jgi:hypothetical protein